MCCFAVSQRHFAVVTARGVAATSGRVSPPKAAGVFAVATASLRRGSISYCGTTYFCRYERQAYGVVLFGGKKYPKTALAGG
ncbi:MAG: hypothetical protein RR540_01420 [Oscillospiraceae bacterium]